LSQLVERNLRERMCLAAPIFADYESALGKITLLESRVYQLQNDLNTFRARPSLSADLIGSSFSSEKARELDKKLIAIQEELSLAYRSINEKSDTIIKLQEKSKRDDDSVIEMQKRVESAENGLRNIVLEREKLTEDRDDLKAYVERQNEEITSLRQIVEGHQKRISELTQANNELLEQIIIIKTKQMAEMNEMNRTLESLKANEVRLRAESTGARSFSVSSLASLDFDAKLDSKPALFSESMAALDELAWNTMYSAGIPSSVVSTFVVRESEVACVTLDYSGKRVYTGGTGKVVNVFNSLDAKLIASLKGPNKAIIDVDCSLDSEFVIAGGSDPIIYTWSLKDHRLTSHFTGHSSKVTSAFFTPDSKCVISGSYDRTIKVWNLADASCKVSIPCISACNSVSLASDGNTIASGSLDKYVRFWSLRSGELIYAAKDLHKGPVSSVQFPREGHYVVSCGKDNLIKVLDVRNFKLIREISHPDFSNNQTWMNFGFSPDGKNFAIGSGNGSVFVWNVDSGKLESTLKSLVAPITSCHWSYLGQSIAAVDKTGSVCVWS